MRICILKVLLQSLINRNIFPYIDMDFSGIPVWIRAERSSHAILCASANRKANMAFSGLPDICFIKK